MVDSWNTYNNEQFEKLVRKNNVQIVQIPPKLTSTLQPLDVYFFRMWKDFISKYSDKILLKEIKVNLSKRNNILKLQSFVHKQFSAPKFRDFIKYSWFKAGYVEERPNAFQTPNEYCFKNLCDKCFECPEDSFITCAYCDRPICFVHIFCKWA